MDSPKIFCTLYDQIISGNGSLILEYIKTVGWFWISWKTIMIARNEFSDYKEKIQFNNKMERYQSIINSAEGLYQSEERDASDFIKDYRLCWLHASDEVTKKANEFISLMQNSNGSNRQKEITAKFNEFILSIRQDMIKDTKLVADDFKHAGAGNKRPNNNAAITELNKERAKSLDIINFNIATLSDYINLYIRSDIIEGLKDVSEAHIANIQRELSKFK